MQLIFLVMLIVEWDFEGLVNMEVVFKGKPPSLKNIYQGCFAEKTKD